MIDFETLKEMTHEDLVSIGVKAFGQRHKIIKEVNKLGLSCAKLRAQLASPAIGQST